MIIAIDGVIVPPEQATISVLDRGLLYGDGVFEVLRTWGGRAVELERHLDRLADTAAALRLRIDRDAIAGAVRSVVDRAIAELDPQPFRDRVRGSVQRLDDMAAPDDRDIRAAVVLTGVADVRVRIVVTRGPGPISARLDTISGGRTVVIAEPIVAAPPFA